MVGSATSDWLTAGAGGTAASAAAGFSVVGSQRWLQRRQLSQPEGNGGPLFGSRQRGQSMDVMVEPFRSQER
jgi:hypothetical protein